MNINKAYKIEDVIKSVKEYINKTNRRVTFEYILLENVNDSLKELVVISDEDKEGYSLKSVLEGLSAFNVTELPKNDKYFNSEKIKNLKNLYFVIEATTKSGEVINESYELNVTKLSR